MAQFDVFANPVPKARPAYPFVVSLQADVVAPTLEQIVAPLVPRQRMAPVVGRLTPVVRLDGEDFVALILNVGRVRSRDLGARQHSLAASRGELLAAIDYLFFGT